MGSKTKLLNFIVTNLNSIELKNNTILDLFAGSASLSGAIGDKVNFISNDIQHYSKILSQTYLYNLNEKNIIEIDTLLENIKKIVSKNIKKELLVDYSSINSLKHFNSFEEKQKELIYQCFKNDYHLFTKYYSGTWWSYEQCVWIDAIREVADRYKKQKIYPFILSSLMFAMAYTSQGTGHYAQYRDAKTLKSLKDICIYRKKSIEPIFTRKIEELFLYGFNNRNKYKNEHWSLDFNDALENFKEGTVYADPPYCFVHYSRFYHALETLVLYDYPDIQTKNNEFVKGRYREKRHQSPFCIKTQVDNAFLNMFSLIAEKNSNLILSYSNTGMISLEKLADIAASIWDVSKIKIVTTNHQHMTLGRQGKRFRDVVECLFIVEA